MSARGFSFTLLHPRYWLTWVLIALWAVVAQLPYRLQMWLGQWLGRLMLVLAKPRRRIAQRNIALCFPELSQTQQQDLLRRHFESNGKAVFETGIAWFMPRYRLQQRFTIIGAEHWDNLPGGALVIGMHLITLEVINVAVNRRYNMNPMYKPHKNPVYDFMQRRGRQRHNPQSRTIARDDMRGMIRVIKEGAFVWYAPDQDYGRKVSQFIPWFGIDAATIATTPRLARMCKAPVVAITHRRRADGSGYEIELHPPFEGFPSGDDHADLVRINQFVEQQARRNPDEYMWVHRRFKTRPRGVASLYDS